MSTSIIIGEVPDEVREELAARAAVCGRTLEDYLREELLALAKRPSAAVWMARVRARKDALLSQQCAAPANAHVHSGSVCPDGAHPDSACPDRAHRDSEPPSAPRASTAALLEVRRDVGQRDVGRRDVG